MQETHNLDKMYPLCTCVKCLLIYQQWMGEDIELCNEIRLLYFPNESKKQNTLKPRSSGYTKEFTGDVYLTINPPNSLKFDKFKKFVEDLLSYDFYTDYIYAFEVTSTAERCPHVHILMRFAQEKEVTRKGYRDAINKGKIKWIKEYIDVKNFKHWCEKNVPLVDFEKVKAYIRKDKVSESKALNDVLTVKWRAENKIQHYYSKPKSVQDDHGAGNEATKPKIL